MNNVNGNKYQSNSLSVGLKSFKVAIPVIFMNELVVVENNPPRDHSRR